MPIVNQIQAVVNQLVSKPVFLYGTKNELNKLTDDVKISAGGIIMLYTLKPIIKNTTISNAINSKFSIYMEFLFKTTFDQYTSQNEIYIQQASDLQDEFLVKLQNYRQKPVEAKFFKIHVNDKENALPVYNKFDCNTTGMNLSLNLDTTTNDGINPNSRPVGWVAGPYG